MTYDNHSIHPSIQKPLNELDRPQVAGQLKTKPERRKDRKTKRQKDEKTIHRTQKASRRISMNQERKDDQNTHWLVTLFQHLHFPYNHLGVWELRSDLCGILVWNRNPCVCERKLTIVFYFPQSTLAVCQIFQFTHFCKKKSIRWAFLLHVGIRQAKLLF